LFLLIASERLPALYTGPTKAALLLFAAQVQLRNAVAFRNASLIFRGPFDEKADDGPGYSMIRNDSSFLRLTDTQLIQISPGGLGYSGGDADSSCEQRP